MRFGLRFTTAPVCLLATLLTGCAVGPDFERPAAPDVSSFTATPLPPETVSADTRGGTAQRFVAGGDIPGQWWTLYKSEPLNRLIERAIASNPGLEASQAALLRARETVRAEEASFLPSISASFNRTRAKASNASLGVPGGGSSLYTLYGASLNLSYSPDVFGGERRQVESLEAQAENQRFQLEATYLTLTSNVVTAAVNEASLAGQVAATQDIIRAQQEELDIVRRQFALGAISQSEVLQQEATLAQTVATLPPLRKSVAQQRNQLATLVGALPSDYREAGFDLASLHLPEQLPVSLPSSLVEQRPDVRAAEAMLHQATADLGVATANLLPKFTLTASYGRNSPKLDDLFSPGTVVWNLISGVTQPIFEGGKLLAERRAATAAQQQAAAQYRSVVLGAFQDVANALAAIETDADALRASLQAERAAASSLEIAKTQFRAGSTTYLSVLNAELTYQNARIALVKAEAQRYADTAALFQALGGGWWNRTDIDPRVAECCGVLP